MWNIDNLEEVFDTTLLSKSQKNYWFNSLFDTLPCPYYITWPKIISLYIDIKKDYFKKNLNCYYFNIITVKFVKPNDSSIFKNKIDKKNLT